MIQLKLRYARPEESEQIIEWMNANPHNHFDPGILKYPTLRVLCAYSDDGPVCYLPIHQVLMMESIAFEPTYATISNLENPRLTMAQALRDLTKGSELIANAGGSREIYFLGGDGGVGKMAEGNGFERVKLGEGPTDIFRMRL